MSSPIDETIANLVDSDSSLLSSRLIELSNLNQEEIGLFEQKWAAIEPKRRRQIVHRLVELADDNFELSFDSIFTSCLKDDDAEVRSKAIEGLWENEDASLIDPLVDMLNKDSSEKVQEGAAAALGKFAMLAEFKKLRSCYAAKVCQALLGMIGDKSKPLEVRRRALEAAAPLSDPQVSKAIMVAYKSHDSKLQASAIYAMGRNCNPSWLPMLLKELASPDAEIRYEAATACGELGEKEAASYLIELVDDADAEVQLAAVHALGKIGGSDVKECLEQFLDNPSETVQQAAEEALHELEMEGDPFSFGG